MEELEQNIFKMNNKNRSKVLLKTLDVVFDIILILGILSAIL